MEEKQQEEENQGEKQRRRPELLGLPDLALNMQAMSIPDPGVSECMSSRARISGSCGDGLIPENCGVRRDPWRRSDRSERAAASLSFFQRGGDTPPIRANTGVDGSSGTGLQNLMGAMNFISWNCQGVGKNLNSNKMEYLANLISSTHAKVIFVCETLASKYTCIDLVNRFPIQDSFVVPAEGRAGGLWIMWSDEMEITIISASQNVILASVVNTSTKFCFSLVCVYGDPHHRRTKNIWGQIETFVTSSPGKPVYCMGDLNDILFPFETTSCHKVNHHRISNFSHLVKQCGLIDMGYHGPAYTWCNKRYSSVPTYERLDRCLANIEWCNVYPSTSVYNLPILISDHAPILTISQPTTVKIKKSFKFENWWLMEKDFQETAYNAWISSVHYPFHTRTTNLAGSLKRWCKKKKPLQQQLDDIHAEIEAIQTQPVHMQDHSKEASLTEQYEQTLTKLTDFYRQRAKRHWAQHGDRNTTFFHNAVLKRRRKNRITAVKDPCNNMLTNPEDIANCFINYFSNIFTSQNPDLQNQTPPAVDEQVDDPFINSIPDKNEILQVLKGMRRNASPGPDGLNVAFYTAAWKWIGDDVTQVIQSFFTHGKLPPKLNETFITLVPKKFNAATPQDFRPISLCNVIYKIIAKTLANRLKTLLPSYIHETQQAFIQGRRISNNITIAQEITHSFQLSSWKEQAFMLKVDLAKAFDRIEWNFIARALARKGLHSHFINLIHECISTATFSVNINGQPFGRFHGSRGIRQGCPLSPYLFVLAVNELSLSLQNALSANNLKGIQLGPASPPIHSLMFADDLIVCGSASNDDAPSRTTLNE